VLNLAKEHLKKGFNPLGVEQHDDDQGVLWYLDIIDIVKKLLLKDIRNNSRLIVA